MAIWFEIRCLVVIAPAETAFMPFKDKIWETPRIFLGGLLISHQFPEQSLALTSRQSVISNQSQNLLDTDKI